MFPALLLISVLVRESPTEACALSIEPIESLESRIRRAVELSIMEKNIPGAVVIVGHRDKLVFAGAFGERAQVPEREAMTRDTLFDLASLTKPVATATAVMLLVESGKLSLTDPIARVLPEFDRCDKGRITIEQLLRHRSGLIADNPLDDYLHGPEEAWKRLADLTPQSAPDVRFVYSDVNFLILGRVVERVSGVPLDTFVRENLYRPLGMKSISFRRRDAAGRLVDAEGEISRFAPTEPVDGLMRRGRVHDPRSDRLDGVAGHAGLFGTADDLAIFAQFLLDEGKSSDGVVVLKPETVRAMISPGDTPAKQRRGLGWDIDTPYSSPRGRVFGPTSFGHTGFTGTSLWIDPETRTYVILLTSRLHPDGKASSPTNLRSRIATIVGESLLEQREP